MSAYAIFLPGAICRAPSGSYGLVTPLTWDTATIFDSTSATRARTSGWSMPPGAWITSWPESPARSGNVAWSRSWALVDSVPLTLKPEAKSSPTLLASTVSPTTATIQASTTHRRRR